jgi:hypothetical protein
MCHWCKEEIKAAALVCKHCGSKDPDHISLDVIRARKSTNNLFRNNNVAKSVQVDQSSLFISRETGQVTEGQQGPDVSYVTGSARNITGDTLKQVEIIFKLYDQSGTELGEALDYTNQLGPNVVWSFRAACMTSEAVSTNIFRAKLDRLIVR